jgi:mannose-6-phosphate isomerase-like protein (cupin superfamily)
VRLLPLLFLAACATGPKEAGEFPLPAGKGYAQNPNLPPGGMIAVIAGAPDQPGPYANRVSLPANFKIMPHSHPDDRLYTVLSGTYTIGLGTEVDSTKLVFLRAGEVYVLPANTPHFHWTLRGPVIFQVSGMGPTGSTYVRPEDDPRKQ